MKNNLANLSREDSFLFKAFESGSTDYQYIWNITEGKYTISDNMMADFGMGGIDPPDFEKVWLSLVHPDDSQRVSKEVRKLLNGANSRLYLEYRIQTEFGDYIWVSSKGLLQRNPDNGQPQILAGIIHRLSSGGEQWAPAVLKAEEGEHDNQRKQLENNNDLLMLLMDTMPLCMNLWNRNIEILACNRETLRLFNAVDYQTFKDNFYFFSPQYQPDGQNSEQKARDMVSQAFENGKASSFWMHCSADGTEIPTEVSFVKLPYLQDYVVASYTRDLRSQRKEEENARKFNSRLQSILNATPLCLNLWNRRFENTMCNKAALDLFDLANEEEYTKGFLSLSPERQPDGSISLEMAAAKIQEAFDTGYCRFRWQHCKFDGELIPAEITLVRIEGLDDEGGDLVAGFTRDMRDQLRTEEIAHKFNSRLQSILNATPLCLNLWNRQMENTMCNKAALELFDLKTEEEYTRGFPILSPEIQPDGSFSSEAAIARIQEAFVTGDCQFRWQHRKLNGELIPAEITLVRIEGLDDDGSDLIAGFTRDLRPQLLAEQAERNAAQRIKAVLDAMPLTCILWNLEGRAFDCNQAAVTMFGAEDKNDVIAHFDEFLPDRQPDGKSSIERKNKKLAETVKLGSCAFEWSYQDRAGSKIPCIVSMMVLHTDEGDVIVAYSQDLRELRETLAVNRRLQQMAYFDWLTGSLSRARFMEDCGECVQSLCREEQFALIIFDFDNFKGLNDTYGHEFGDTVLRRVIKAITLLLPPKALLGRYGGDEFLVQIIGMERTELEDWIQKVLLAVRETRFERDEKTVATSISIGAAFWNHQSTDVEALINRADQALYEAKRLGRNGSVVW